MKNNKIYSLENLAKDFTFILFAGKERKNQLKRLAEDFGKGYLSCVNNKKYLPDISLINKKILLTNAKPEVLRYIQKHLQNYFEVKEESCNVFVEGNGHVRDSKDYVIDIGAYGF